jgi:hypothetical protein
MTYLPDSVTYCTGNIIIDDSYKIYAGDFIKCMIMTDDRCVKIKKDGIFTFIPLSMSDVCEILEYLKSVGWTNSGRHCSELDYEE